MTRLFGAFPLGNQTVRFQAAVRYDRYAIGTTDQHFRFFPGEVRIASSTSPHPAKTLLVSFPGTVLGPLAFLQSRTFLDDERQRFKFDFDQPQRIAGMFFRVCGDGENFIAVIEQLPIRIGEADGE
jgi:hypothetical protein